MRYFALSLDCLILSSTGRFLPSVLTVMHILLVSFVASGSGLAQTNWRKLSPAKSPPGRYLHALVYDQARARVVLFGGAGTQYFADTWEWVGGATWVQRFPKTRPPARVQHAMAYDASRRRTVLFGGSPGRTPGLLGDTWEWDGTQWTRLSPASSPPARSNHTMAYDSSRKRVVLWGGLGGANRTVLMFTDTWEWDGKRWLRTSNSGPTWRVGHDMTYDAARKRIVLFGGQPLNNQTWEYDSTQWYYRGTSGAPPTRWRHALAYDRARARVVLFGGNRTNSGARLLADTWEWEGNRWTQRHPTASPPPMAHHKMVYCDIGGYILLFGGQLDLNKPALSDTWVYATTEPLTSNPTTVSIVTGGAHTFSLDAGTANASRLYWVFGSVTGTSPGVTLASAVGSVTIPLNPDVYTDLTVALANTTLLTKTRGTLDNQGKATATLNVPKNLPAAAIGAKLYHAYLVYDAKNNYYMASNPVELMLVK